MATAADPYADFRPQTEPVKDKLGLLTQLAEELKKAELNVASKEAEFKAAQAKMAELAERRIPTLMEEIGMTEFKTKGLKITLKKVIRVGAADSMKKPQAIEWLEKHGHGGLIKRVFTIFFNKDDEAWAKKFAADLKKRKKPLDSQQVASVHAQTLGAFIRERREAGDDVPLDVFGAFEQTYANVEMLK